MIIGIYGDVGEGKTAIAVGDYLKPLCDKGFNIYSNIYLNFKYNKLTLDFMLDLVEKDIQPPDKMIIFIDEATTLLDSRGSGQNKVQKVLTYLLLMSRKIGAYFIYTSQFPNLIDIRLWELTKIKIFCKKVEIKKTIIVIKDIYERNITGIINIKELSYINPYYKLYNTNEIVRVQYTKRYDKKTSTFF